MFMFFYLPILTFFKISTSLLSFNVYFPRNFNFKLDFFFLNVCFSSSLFLQLLSIAFGLFFFSVNLQEFPTLSFLISKISHSYFSLPLLGTLSSSTRPIFFKIVAKIMNNTKAF